jgi:hypothetical protein
MASDINNTFRQVGIATGIAGLGALFQAQVQSKTQSLLEADRIPAPKAHSIAHAIATQRGGGGGGSHVVAAAAQAGFVSALNEILLVGAGIALAGAILGVLLVRSSDFAHGAETSPEAAAVAA